HSHALLASRFDEPARRQCLEHSTNLTGEPRARAYMEVFEDHRLGRRPGALAAVARRPVERTHDEQVGNVRGRHRPCSMLAVSLNCATSRHSASRLDLSGSSSAHGTAATTTPCRRHDARGASASNTALTVPRSNARHRRRPSPPSYPGQRRPHRPHRPRARFVGRTRATNRSCSWSYSTDSNTVLFSTPNSAFHRLTSRTPFPRSSVPDLRQPRT